MIEGWKTYSDVPIRFESNMDTSLTVFYLPDMQDKSAEQATVQVTEQAVIEFCKTPKNTNEIMEYLGLKHREHFRSAILKPMIEKGLLELTIPDKPKSPKQKYRTKKDR